MPVTVYGAIYSTYVRTVLITLREKGVEYAVSDVDIFKPIPPDHMARQPWGKIPVLDHDGFQIYETGAVTRYIDEAFPGPALQPADAAARARMGQVMSVIDSYAYKPIVTELFVQRAAMPMMGQSSDEPKIAAALPEAEKTLDVLAGFKGQHAWMAGDHYSLADPHLVPVIAYLVQTPEGRAMLGKRPALASWWQQVASRPSVVATRSPLER